jgi:hypothetical protein
MADTWAACDAAINTAVTNVSGIFDVHQGYHRYTDSENWEFDTTGLTAEVQGRFRFNRDSVNYKPLDVSTGYYYAELAIYLPKEVNSNMTLAWALATEVQKAIGDGSNYDTIGMVPQTVSMNLDRIDVIQSDGIAYFTFGSPGSAGIEIIDP